MKTKSTLLFGGAVTLAVAIAVLAPKPDASQAGGPGAVDPNAALPEGHPPLAGSAPAAAPVQGPFATVLESMDSGGYTYARVEMDGEETWVAGPVTPLAEGDRIGLGGAMGMQNFHAASLDRTFESILFVNRFQGPSADGAGEASAPAAGANAGSGTALEVLHAAGYTYVRVDQGESELWVAGMAVDIAEGQTVTWNAGSVMTGFNSPSLERTFDEILFVDGLRVTG